MIVDSYVGWVFTSYGLVDYKEVLMMHMHHWLVKDNLSVQQCTAVLRKVVSWTMKPPDLVIATDVVCAGIIEAVYTRQTNLDHLICLDYCVTLLVTCTCTSVSFPSGAILE